MGIKENLTKIKEQIGSNKVKIIAVTKYANWQQTLEAYNLGIRDFGESYVQDAIEKLSRKLQNENSKNLIQWHLIGRLQKNKAKYVVGKFFLIHSVDSVELAEIINKIANSKGLTQNILLQVNISQEAQKAGFNKDELKSSLKTLLNLPNINIQGLMTLAPKTEDKKTIKDCFLGLHSLRDELNKENICNLKELSMGMSNDYLTAIECGSTMVRIGRAIFSN
ncbi:MAG: YggS family pyridoxal phosphate-dependent enzyme [Candidatus Melainabacteria bacterium]|nr:YggS family pyridoxal phosphate-dependent enzyme [Candidatus Melainabacteria bacterium]